MTDLYFSSGYAQDRGRICFLCDQQHKFECDDITVCSRDDVSNKTVCVTTAANSEPLFMTVIQMYTII